jgi:hypothetical protein
MSDRDFVKLAQKAVSNLFDWSIQTELGLNINISDILLSDTVNVADQVSEFIKTVKRDSKHPLFNNQVINLLAKPENKKAKANSVNNLYLTNRDNKISNQNEIIFSFHELKEHLKSVGNEKLYDRLIALSILQSGLTNSPISFTSLLPYEDFIRVYNKTLSALDQVPVSVFNKLNVFERENWNDDDIVPSVAARWTKTSKYNPDMKFLSSKIKDAVSKKVIPPVVTISTFNQATNKDVITYTWEKDQSEVLTAEDRKKGIKYKEKKAQMRREGDYSYINKGLFKRVTDDYGTPLLTSYMYNGKEYFSYVYKMINAWGDSYRASEYYNVAKSSVIDNGYLKVDREVDDKMIIPYFTTVKTAGKAVSSQPGITSTKREYTPEYVSKANLPANGVFVFGSNTEGRHGAGAAKTAVDQFGATYGQAEGLQGKSYGIITKDLAKGRKSIPLYSPDNKDISSGIKSFIEFAHNHPELKFYVSKLGSSLAGYSINEIKGVFNAVNSLYRGEENIENYIPDNVILPKEYEVRDVKPDTVSQKEWDALTQEEKNKINEC